ncbi:MAG: flagella basal body P-ring formation protein FlgA [Gammaproteobacteria bacterium HGW-Gammaproteobacteria-3]|nr:MAG: flagella basal body P-ring formation protein FlgA [Gammaproteobacteria bacterium HGW-Gammaproteobacteria-3]
MLTKKLLLLLITGLFSTHGYAQTHYQTHAAIYQAVKTYIAGNIDSSSDYDISIAPLDSRLQLPECSEHLQAFKPGEQPLQAGRLSIGVRCGTASKWFIFTSVTLKIYANVWVLTQPLRRGQILMRRHLVRERRDTAHLRQGYIKRLELLENKQAKRNLTAGTVLNTGLVTEPVLIKRGERIIIRAADSAFDIRMQGLALMNGIKGQSINVKNISSGRTVTAKVIKSGLVSVTY